MPGPQTGDSFHSPKARFGIWATTCDLLVDDDVVQIAEVDGVRAAMIVACRTK